MSEPSTPLGPVAAVQTANADPHGDAASATGNAHKQPATA